MFLYSLYLKTSKLFSVFLEQKEKNKTKHRLRIKKDIFLIIFDILKFQSFSKLK